jgi:uncharacterized protein (TIGR00299 family) protein
MILAAISDCGVSEEYFREVLGSLGIEELEGLKFEEVMKNGIRAKKFDPIIHTHHHHHDHDGHSHEHNHKHSHHHHRHLSDIIALIDSCEKLPCEVKRNAKAVFCLIGEAEAKVHGTTPEKVHFHEVGAVDSIVDVVGCCLGLYELGLGAIYCPKVAIGSGTVKCEHGVVPVPAPATAILIEGMKVCTGDVESELLTPTGAALLKHFCLCAAPPEYVPLRSGYGAGTKDFAQIANVLRLTIGKIEDLQRHSAENEAILIETNIDDASGETIGDLVSSVGKLCGVLDAWTEPVYMKKNRPAVKLCVLCESNARQESCKAILRSGITLGLRWQRVKREVLRRSFELIDACGHKINIKQGFLADELVFSKPEYEDCAKMAREMDISSIEAMRIIGAASK